MKWYIRHRRGGYVGVINASVSEPLVDKSRAIQFDESSDADEFVDNNFPDSKPLDWVISRE